jgi:outer membrane protein assembly factor BamB
VRGRLLVSLIGALALNVAGSTPASASAAHVSPTIGSFVAAAPANGAWTVYHRDDGHTGYDPTQPAASTAVGGWTSPALDGAVYAEPLVYNGFVYTATLSGTVYALNQSDGTVAWSKNVGAPHPKDETNVTLCGNIDPMGILSTPVIDQVANRIYVSEQLNSDTAWHVFGIDLSSHSIVLNTQIKSSVGTGLDWTIQQQRGALALANGYVYVPFGGRIGDCGPYHGWVIGVPTNGSTSLAVYESPSTAEGVWAAGGPVVDDSTGNVFFATGNAIPCSGSVNSDSVIRTGPTLGAATSFFQPNDWSNHWCGPDLDLGSTSPVLIGPSLMFMTGKYGQGFLLDPANLGGKDGQLFPAQSPYAGADVCLGTHSDATFGSFAYAAPYVYISCEGNGMVGLSVDTTAKSFTPCGSTCPAPNWFTAEATTLGPPIVAGGAVWAVSTNGGGLYGFDAATGAQIYHSAGFTSHRFSTPSEAGGQIFVGAGNAIRSFNMVSGCSSVTLSATPPGSTTSGSPVTVTASASGPSCASPQYEFWLRPSNGAWAMVQGYGPSNTFNWTNTTPAGAYYVGVHARNSTSTAPFESVASIAYTLTPQACSAVNLAAAPASPQPSGTQVTLTATATCPNANPLYEFWAKWQGSNTWQLLRGYTTSSAYVWNSTGALPGVENFGVWVHDASNSNSYDQFTSIPFTVRTATCSSVTASATPSSVVHGAGTHVTITGAASGCTNPSPLYEVWMRPASSSTWTLVRGWSSTATYDWNSTGALPGTVYFGVWTKDAASTNAYDAVASTTVTVT